MLNIAELPKFEKNPSAIFTFKFRPAIFTLIFFDFRIGPEPSKIDQARKMLQNAMKISSVDQF